MVSISISICFHTVSVYLVKVNNGNTRIMNEICSMLTVKTIKPSQWRFSGLCCILVIYFMHCFCVSIAEFEQVNAWSVIACKCFISTIIKIGL